MDAGSGINLIFARTLKAMNISLEWLRPIDCSFHEIVPRSANHPLGRIELDVCFSDRGNYQREKLECEVMDCPSQYNAIMGQPAFAWCMIVPHYAYLVLKIPGPKGVIMITGSFAVFDTCDKVLPAKTHWRAATSNTKSREAPRTAGGPWSLGRRPAKLPARTSW
jgi:hypothetical protein